MNALTTLRVVTRMRLLVSLALIGLIVLCLTALFQLKATMLTDRQDKTRNLVETGIGVISYNHKLFTRGKLSEDDAKTAARESLRAMRYGDGGYLFGFDTSGVYFLNAANPAIEGLPMMDMQDAHGSFLVRETIAVAKGGGGFVNYWFPKAGEQNPQPNLSYAALFEPWGWVLGTSIYIDDVAAQYRRAATLLGGISLVLIVLLGLAGWQIARSIQTQLGGEPASASEVMHRVADGDLSPSIGSVPSGSMLHALGDMVISLRQMMSQINYDANQLVGNAEQITSASQKVAQAAEQQSDATSSMAAAIEELTVSSAQISDNAYETSLDSSRAVELSSEGTVRVQQASSAIERIAETVSDASTRIHALDGRARQVSSIANVIKDIAGQTNLLALNAAIEAARAGEQGRGFAVVADEVRKLAERTSNATTEIEEMVVGIQSDTAGAVGAMNAVLPEVQEGIQLAASASKSLQSIEEGAHRTLERIKLVADATREQSAVSTSISQRVEQIANMVEETTAAVDATAASSRQLETIANNLSTQISRFRA